MTLLGRNMNDIILVDNSPNSFLFQPENAYHIKNFFDDKTDRELITLYNFLEDITGVQDVRPIEQWRKQLEHQPNQRQTKFVKIQNSENEMVSMSTKQQLRHSEEKAHNIETEPDLRRDARDGAGNRDGARKLARPAPLTDRISSNEKPLWEVPSESSAEVDAIDVGLPSPKESDTLINHRVAGAYLENNSETDSDKKNGSKNGSKHTSPARNGVIAHRTHEPVETVVDQVIDGHEVEQVRYLTGLDNLNSPLGRHVKIDFQKNE
jgi:hypothetical protein